MPWRISSQVLFKVNLLKILPTYSVTVHRVIIFNSLFRPGDFSEAVVYLDVNHLTRFDSDVYENLLEQMHRSTSDAGLYVRNSNISNQ